MQEIKAPRGRPRKTIAVETIWRDRREDGDPADIRVRLLLLRDACRRRWPELLDQDFADFSGVSRERMKQLMQRGAGRFEWTNPDKEALLVKGIDLSGSTPANLLIETITKRLETPDGIAPPTDYFTRKVTSIQQLEAMVLSLQSTSLVDMINLATPEIFVIEQQTSRLKLQGEILSFIQEPAAPVGRPLYVVHADTQKYGLIALAQSITAEWLKIRDQSEKLPVFVEDLGDTKRSLDLSSVVKKLAEFFQLDRRAIDDAETQPERILNLVAERAAETSTLFIFAGWRGNGGDPLAATRRLVRGDPALEVLTALINVQPIGTRSRFVVFSEGQPNELRHLTVKENFHRLDTVPLRNVAESAPKRLRHIDEWIRQGILDGEQETDDLTCDLATVLADLEVPAELILAVMERKETKERHIELCRRLLDSLPTREASLLKLLSVAEVGLGPQACADTLSRIDRSSVPAAILTEILNSLSAKMPSLVYGTSDQNSSLADERSEESASYHVDPVFCGYVEYLWAEAAPAEVVTACRALAALADKRARFVRQAALGKVGQYVRDYRFDLISCLFLGKSLLGRDGPSAPSDQTRGRPFVSEDIFAPGASDEIVARAAYDTLFLHNVEKAPQYRLTRDFGADDIRLELLSLLLLGRSILREPFTDDASRAKSPQELIAALFARASPQLPSEIWNMVLIAQDPTDGRTKAWRQRLSRMAASFAVAAHRLKADYLVDYAKALAATLEPLPPEDAIRLGKVAIDSLINQGHLEAARKHCDTLLRERLGFELPEKPEDLAPFLDEAIRDLEKLPHRACTGLLCRRAVIEHLSGQAKAAWEILKAIGAIDDIRAASEFAPTPTLTGHPSRIMLRCAILRATQHNAITVTERNELVHRIERVHKDNWRRMGDVKRELPWLHLETCIVERGLAKVLNDREDVEERGERLDRARLALDRTRNSIWQGGPNHPLPYLHYLLEKSELELQRFELSSTERYLNTDDTEMAWRECVDSAEHLFHLADYYKHQLLACDARIVLADAFALRYRLAKESANKPGALAAFSGTDADPTSLAQKVKDHLRRVDEALLKVKDYHLQENRAEAIKENFSRHNAHRA